ASTSSGKMFSPPMRIGFMTVSSLFGPPADMHGFAVASASVFGPGLPPPEISRREAPHGMAYLFEQVEGVLHRAGERARRLPGQVHRCRPDGLRLLDHVGGDVDSPGDRSFGHDHFAR